MFEALVKANPTIPFYKVTDPKFKDYGQILKPDPRKAAALMTALQAKTIPETGNQYVASDATLESQPLMTDLLYQVFGGLPIEAGYCNGHSYQLNCLEWHNAPEVNVATTDICLFLGHTPKLHDDYYQVSDVAAFFIPKGTMIAIYGTTMHFAPLRTCPEGFKCLVVLLEGTNTDLSAEAAMHKDKTLFKYNKWLIAHPDNAKFTDQGAFAGIIGPNLELKLP